MKAITNAHVCTMDGRDFENGYILIEGKKIKAVGQMPEFDPSIEVAYDAKGQYAVPGLIDAHCHVGLYKNGEGFSDDFVKDSPLCQTVSALDSIEIHDRSFADAKKEGITTVVTGPGSTSPVGGQFVALKTSGESLDDMILKAPCAMKMSMGQNVSRYGGTKEVAALIRKTLSAAKEYKEKNLPYNSELAPLVPVLDGAIPVKVHAHAKEDIEAACDIAREFGLKLSIEHGTDADLVAEKLKSVNAVVCAGPLITDRNKRELLRHDPALVTKLYEKNIPFAIVTDHPELPVEYLRLSACLAVRCGLSPDAALSAITKDAAKACNISDRVGSLSPGLDADIAIFSAHPCDFYAECTAVFISGKSVL